MSFLKLQAMQPLFYSPLSVFELEDAVSLNSDLLAETSAMRSLSPGLDRSNWHGWHSNDDFFERSEPGCQALRKHIVDAIQLCTRNVSQSGLTAFLKRTETKVVWMKPERYWRWRVAEDEPGQEARG
jgi:hypothetical protein